MGRYSINQSTILKEIKLYYPFPPEFEIGFGIKQHRFKYLRIGDNYEVLLDLNDCVSFFHTHPKSDYDNSTFSKYDYEIMFEYKFETAYLGHIEDLAYINFNTIPKRLQNKIKDRNYCSIKLRDELNYYVDFIDLF